MALMFKCDSCDEIYDTYIQAFECHLPLDYTPTWWEQLLLTDVFTEEEQDEMDCE